ncbi:hypothetical protein H0H92_007132 [Tricholoma furcatifolium]|nr:hypothetical protein H0H92_007132 [Tricholoma furcatifolium]
MVNDHKVKALIDKLIVIFSDKAQYKKLLSCEESNAQKVLDLFQRLLDNLKEPLPGFKDNLIIAAQRLARQSGLYPTGYNLDGITVISEVSEDSGSCADIFKGKFRGRDVCLKVIRRTQQIDLARMLKAVSKEAILWGQLNHPNLVPFYGIFNFRGTVALVSPWMENGNIHSYFKKHQDSNRVRLALEVAQGLGYLHDHGIVHGDLKGPNLLVDEFERICVGDFGLSSVSDKEILALTSFSSLSSQGGSVRWQAPEIFDPDDGMGEEDEQENWSSREQVTRNTMQSDIYAWACVAYEIFSGKIPFKEIKNNTKVMIQVLRGRRPSRPSKAGRSWSVWGLTADIWSSMEECWHAEPAKRPTIGMIIQQLEMAAPHNMKKEVRGAEHLLPGQFREIIRSGKEEIDFSADVLA